VAGHNQSGAGVTPCERSCAIAYTMSAPWSPLPSHARVMVCGRRTGGTSIDRSPLHAPTAPAPPCAWPRECFPMPPGSRV
jgi:hypothetical protein